MGSEQLYFIIGFLLGTMLMGSFSIVLFILYHEWIKKFKETDDLF